MKIVRFLDANGVERLGQLTSDTAERGASTRTIDGDLFGAHSVTSETATVDKLLAPLDPRAILCIGLNYREHAAEGGHDVPEYPVLFFKYPSTVCNPGDPIILPRVEPEAVDYECELAVVIGKKARNVSKADALDYVLGYTAANDVSGRIWQIKKGGGQWNRGKSFDTFCPLGPCIVTTDEIPDPNALSISTTVSGEKLQDWTTSDMIFDVPTLIEFLSQDTTLLPGTVLLTGTPQGVGGARKPPRWLRHGDIVTIELQGVGQLTNPVQGH